MIKKFLFVYFLALVLVGCGSISSTDEVPTLDSTKLNKTAVSAATAAFLQTESMLPTATLTLVSTWTPAPTIDRTRPPLLSPTPEIPCNRAAAGRPIDVTIPDGTIMAPGEIFSKTWRLENVGSCAWTRLYTLTFFSGNSMNAIHNHNLFQEVPPGSSIDLTVDMVAPQTSGIYQSNWMLQDAHGGMFGIGPNSVAPFWV
ncbi:MAG: NBR1-Ig-like domain-containing protein, partial [Anaerolineales bacterium]